MKSEMKNKKKWKIEMEKNLRIRTEKGTTIFPRFVMNKCTTGD